MPAGECERVSGAKGRALDFSCAYLKFDGLLEVSRISTFAVVKCLSQRAPPSLLYRAGKEPRCGNNFIYLGTMLNVSILGRANVYTRDDGLLIQTY